MYCMYCGGDKITFLVLSCSLNFFVVVSDSYYKNVRKEWASLVSTPPYAQFQDALAFTRSLGDLHLHTYGIIFCVYFFFFCLL